MRPKTKKEILFVGLQFVLFIAFVIDIKLYTLPQLVPDFVLGICLALAIVNLHLNLTKKSYNFT